MSEPTAPAWALPLAVAGVLLEAAAALAAGVAGVVAALDGRGSLALALGLGAFALAAGLTVGGLDLRRGRVRARGALVTWQLVQGATAVAVLGAVTGGTPAVVPIVAGLALAVAVAVTAGLLVAGRPR